MEKTISRDSTGTGTGTVPDRNIIALVRSRNIFCSGAPSVTVFLSPRYLAYNTSILQTIDMMLSSNVWSMCYM